jgi:hypothetical protein
MIITIRRLILTDEAEKGFDVIAAVQIYAQVMT